MTAPFEYTLCRSSMADKEQSMFDMGKDRYILESSTCDSRQQDLGIIRSADVKYRNGESTESWGFHELIVPLLRRSFECVHIDISPITHT